MCEDIHKEVKEEKKKMKAIENRKRVSTKGQFIKGVRKGLEQRDRISLAKESMMYYRGEETKRKEKTVAGSVIPSFKTMYVQGLIGMSADKLYGEKAYLKGMNKRPRLKLTLGNMVIRKKRKRVEGVEVKDTQYVGGQRARQRIRAVWDILNRKRRDQYRKYRKEREAKNGSKEVVQLRKARRRYH